MLRDSDPVPRWFKFLQNSVAGIYGAVAASCLLAAFLIGAVGAIVYRDFDSYTLAGNPWDGSSFPWYVIWPMRLMSIVGIQALVALGFFVLFFAIAAISQARIGSPVVKRLGIGTIVVAIELAAAAWFGRWFG